MPDQREAIMSRLMALAWVDGVVRVGRNVIDPGDRRLPAVILLEGDEAAVENDPVDRGPLQPRRVEMTPHIVIVQGAPVDEIGPTLSTLRAALIAAVLQDSELAALTVNGRGVRLMGMQSDLALGRQMLGQMAVQFQFTYLLDPARIAA